MNRETVPELQAVGRLSDALEVFNAALKDVLGYGLHVYLEGKGHSEVWRTYLYSPISIEVIRPAATVLKRGGE